MLQWDGIHSIKTQQFIKIKISKHQISVVFIVMITVCNGTKESDYFSLNNYVNQISLMTRYIRTCNILIFFKHIYGWVTFSPQALYFGFVSTWLRQNSTVQWCFVDNCHRGAACVNRRQDDAQIRILSHSTNSLKKTPPDRFVGNGLSHCRIFHLELLY